MTLYAPIWQQNNTYPASLDRQALSLWTTGVIAAGDLAVTQRGAGANMSVDVAAGGCVIEGTEAAGQGRYLATSDAVVNVPLAAAPGAGSSRIDLVVATVRDSAFSGTDDDWIIQAVTGTPAASPVAPSAPASSLVLASVAVASLAASIVDANITDARVAVTPTPLTRSDLPAAATTGQLLATADGSAWIRRSSGWAELAGPSAVQLVQQPSNIGIGTSGTTWMSMTLPAPGRPVLVQVVADGHFTTPSDLGVGGLAVGVSEDGGSTWAMSLEQLTTVANGFCPAAVSRHLTVAVSGSAAITVRALARRAGGPGLYGSAGQLSATLIPA